ncbi:TRAP transporter substrate-binding protein [Agrococcus sp. BE272]|uniref:TRAP transporter substrate-binding protein n=1 Tax=Agrococcus sp. BE272 TaxID=2817727 RepID=UPI00286091CD|nr:TRAP transporter substrate-binding protein [Agrococcus sp. BE272]MDR7235023.1 tripartite ATP-independent transporter DctP family solute receptor [Agrococcus sp. BE272]
MRTTKTLGIVAAVGAAALMLSACSGAAAPSGSGEPAAGTTTTLRLALNQAEEHPSYIALTGFGERLSEATDGRYEIEVYANELLGAQAETLQFVSDGSVDLSVVSGTQLENLNPDFGVLNLPTVFSSIDHQMGALSDDEVVGDLYASLEESNAITVLGGLTQGERHVYTTFGPVQEPGDLSGKKLRVQESELHIAMAEAMGASATPLAFGELYGALQSGVVDAAENNAVSYFTQRHFEVAPHFTSTNHLIGTDYVIVNSDRLAGMSEEDRAAFEEEWDATWAEHTELWQTATDDAIAQAEAGGATFHELDSDAFADALAPMVEEFIETDEQQALFDAIRASAE